MLAGFSHAQAPHCGLRYGGPGATVPASVSRCAVAMERWAGFAFSACSPIAHVCGFQFHSGRATNVCAGFGFGAHISVADYTSQFRHVQSMGHAQSARTVSPQMWAGFAAVVHAVRACVGGFQSHCASSAKVAAGVSFSAQSVANAASFGFRDFRRPCHE